MSIESINRRLVTHGAVYTCSGDDGRLEIYDYADADLRALLKVAEAAKALCNLRGDVTPGDRAALRAALDELEAQE